MPPKRNQAPNAFFFFMQSLKPQLQRQGVILEHGNRTLAELAGPRWAELTEEERQPFVELAKQNKENRKYAVRTGNNNSKMDCTGQLISTPCSLKISDLPERPKRVDTISLNEQRRRKERKLVVESWTGKDVCSEHFFMIAFMSLCDMPDDKFMPCEVAVAEFSLRQGVHRHFHSFIDPGTIPMGYRYEAMKKSEATHKIPIRGLATDSYRDIYEALLRFINPRRHSVFPPLFCKSSETKLVEFALEWLATRAGSSTQLKKVYELEGLVCDLHAESVDAEVKMTPSKHQANELLSTTVFDYESGSRCTWHEENEVRFCALGTVKRYCYCLSDFLCGAFNIDMTSNHLPERPDSEPCTVITARSSGDKARDTATLQTRTGNQENQPGRTDYLATRNNSYDSKPSSGSRLEKFKSRLGRTKKQYARRGPTYDEESLKSSEGNVVTSAASASSVVPMGLPSLGRGRGRGLAIPTQPLRRPNLANDGTRGAGKVPFTGSRPSDVASIESGSVPSPHASVGVSPNTRAGVRVPSTAPKVWAGGRSAPPPSAAPLPPTAWHEDTNQFGGSGFSSSPWSMQYTNSNASTPDVPAWTSVHFRDNYSKLQNHTMFNTATNQRRSGKENGVTNLREGFQDFSLFDKDSYDY